MLIVSDGLRQMKAAVAFDRCPYGRTGLRPPRAAHRGADEGGVGSLT